MSAKFVDILVQSAAQSKARTGKAGRKAPPPARPGSSGLFTRLERLYAAMEEAYEACAAQAGLSCTGCERNCCTSFFRHHTYVEWAFLWRGLNGMDKTERKLLVDRAEDYLTQTRIAMAADVAPSAMCPLNEKGLCVLYSHRLMICRMHGTRNVFSLPDGGQRFFPGCARFVELPCAAPGQEADTPCLDRTPFYTELAALETMFLQRAGRPLPRVNLTIAEMMVLGPPRIR